jgi:serine/threonine protein kinase
VDRGVFGTPEYMSPEQALGNATDARTDLYSVGVVLYECLTGKRPFHSDEENSLADAVVNRGIVSVRALAPYVPEQLDAVVTRALAKDPDERPQSARELQRDLVVFTRYLRDSRSGEGDVVLPLVRRRDTIPPSLGGRPGTSRE